MANGLPKMVVACRSPMVWAFLVVMVGDLWAAESVYEYQGRVCVQPTSGPSSGGQTRISCGKLCLTHVGCTGFSHSVDACRLNLGTDAYSRDSDCRYFASEPWVVLPRVLIVGCSSSGAFHPCERAYDGGTQTAFTLGASGFGYTASTGWLVVDLADRYLVTGVRLYNRCWEVYSQIRDLVVSSGVPATDTQISLPCHSNCSDVDWESVAISPRWTSSVTLAFVRKCYEQAAKVGLQEVEIQL